MASRTKPRRSPRGQAIDSPNTSVDSHRGYRGASPAYPHREQDGVLQRASSEEDENDLLLNASTETYNVDVVDDISPCKVYKHTRSTPTEKPRKRLYPSLDSPESSSPGNRQNFSSPTYQTPPKGKKNHSSPKPRPGHVKRDPDRGSDWGMVCTVCVAAIACIIVFLVFWPVLRHNPDAPSMTHREKLVHDFDSMIKAFVDKFPMQSRRLWIGFSGVNKRVMRDRDPIEPASSILVYVATEDGRQTSECVARSLAHLVNEVYPQQTKIVELTHLSHLTKLEVDSNLHKQLNAGAKVILVPDLNLMNAQTAKMFFSYCDNVNAPFKDVHFIFTVGINENEYNKEVMPDENVERLLSSSWREMDEDTFSPLWSRIGNNVLLVRQETRDVLDSQCDY